MKISESFNKFLDNWPVKAACFFTAVCLYIFYTLSIQDSRSFSVPLIIESSSGITAANSYPKHVRITLKGKSEEISLIRESEVKAYLDLNYLSKDGTYKLPVLVNLPQQAQLFDTLEVHVSPQEVNLAVEEQISGFVPVSALINGKPAYGYEIKSITVKPDTVEVTGPRSMVLNCTRLQTQPVSVKNAEVSFEKTVFTENLGSILKLKNNEKLNVTVEIVPSGSVKKFSKNEIVYNGINENLEVLPGAKTVDFTLSGNLIELEKYSAERGAVFVDCSGITESGVYELPVLINVPARFSVTEKSIEKVSVEVLKKNVELEQEIISEEADAAGDSQ